MSKTKHTPGPWNWGKGDEVVTADEGRVYVAWLPSAKTARLRGMVRADAHLIAAAPDMHEALKAIKETVEGHFDDQCEYCRLALEAISAAIAKAEGRS